VTAPEHRRRIVPVACRTISGEPDGIHLSLEQWLPQWEEWATGAALCGQSAEQGALPADTPITCTGYDGSCESYRDSYQRAIDGRPTAEQELIDSLRAEVARAGHRTERRCSCGVAPDPGICPLEHDGLRAGGHCKCAHPPMDRAQSHRLAEKQIRATARNLYADAGIRVLAALDGALPPADRAIVDGLRAEVARHTAANLEAAERAQREIDRLRGEVDTLTAELEAAHTAFVNQPVLRHCTYPGCMHEFDIGATTMGREPSRSSWSGKGWLNFRPIDGWMCPDHVPVVWTAGGPGPHLPRWEYGTGGARSILRCPCGWDSPRVRSRGYAVEAWKDHLLTPEPAGATDAS
jgi:hypothetical protein